MQANPQFSDVRSESVEPGEEDRCSPCFEIMGFDVFIDEDLRYSPEIVMSFVKEQHFVLAIAGQLLVFSRLTVLMCVHVCSGRGL